MPSPTAASSRRPHLNLFDALCIIVGIVVGTAIFRSPPIVFQNVADAYQAFFLWGLAGCLSFVGALCYAELATSYEQPGGDYAFLQLSFGKWMGFLFSWAQLTIVLTGSIGAMAYTFADYGLKLTGLPEHLGIWFACAAIATLTLANCVGIIAGKWAQNILTVIKMAGLGALILAGFLAEPFHPEPPNANTAGPANADLGLAMVFVLYAFGGWNDAAFVAAEIKDPHRSIPRALLIGISLITLIYFGINGAYLWVLGLEGVRNTMTPAADVLSVWLGDSGGRFMSILVMISALGAINGMILTGARVYASAGQDHRALSWLARWDARRDTPLPALVAQGIISILLVFAVGSESGRQCIDWTLGCLRIPQIPWHDYFGGFETLVAGSAPVFWSFFLLTGIALVVLRFKYPDQRRPFNVPGYPWTPLIFCLTCVYMLIASVRYAKGLVLLGVIPLAVGAIVFWCTHRSNPKD